MSIALILAFASLVWAVAIMLCPAVPVHAAGGSQFSEQLKYNAVSVPSSWATEEIALAREAGLVTDSAARNYAGAITREQFCELLVRLYDKLVGGATASTTGSGAAGAGMVGADAAGAGAALVGGASPFADTDNPAVVRAHGLGLVSGVSTGVFDPNREITRQEICAMLVRCIDKAVQGADISSYKVSAFSDGEKIDAWARPFVYYAYDHKIMSGMSEGAVTIAPLDNVTCEQAIVLVYRAHLGKYAAGATAASGAEAGATATAGAVVRVAPFEFADGHADTITTAMERGESLFQNSRHIDLQRLGAYNAPVQVFAIWCADKYVADAYKYANSAIDFFEGELAAHSDIIELALSLDDIERNARNGKISAILALEGGEPLDGKLDNLDHFYNRGVRLITLTWNRENELGYGVGSTANADKGLKPFGVDCVKRMNELGMIIDVSHLNDAGFWDVDRLSAKPYMASHSNARSVTAHARNLSDAQIKALVNKGGIIGLNMYPGFLAEPGDIANIDSIKGHIERFITLGAGDNLGLGSDFDGISAPPVGIKDVSSLKTLEGTIADAFGNDVAAKIMSDNYYAFFKRFFG
ncbi:MAG: membrane dipeptidase [Oscillospiraceae bacterium]|nr:membrane dipeptidase [Oscillospiraceae bacterium]